MPSGSPFCFQNKSHKYHINFSYDSHPPNYLLLFFLHFSHFLSISYIVSFSITSSVLSSIIILFTFLGFIGRVMILKCLYLILLFPVIIAFSHNFSPYITVIHYYFMYLILMCLKQFKIFFHIIHF